jgi:hypothetical protein
VTEHLLEEQLGHSFCHDGLGTGYESYHLSAAVICNGEDRVEPLRRGQFSDEVHSDDFKGLSFRRGIDRL